MNNPPHIPHSLTPQMNPHSLKNLLFQLVHEYNKCSLGKTTKNNGGTKVLKSYPILEWNKV